MPGMGNPDDYKKYTKWDKVKNYIKSRKDNFITAIAAGAIVLSINYNSNLQDYVEYYNGVSYGSSAIQLNDSVDLYQDIARGRTFGRNPEPRYYIGRVANSDIDTIISKNLSYLQVWGELERDSVLKSDFTGMRIPEFKKINKAKVYVVGDTNQ